MNKNLFLACFQKTFFWKFQKHHHRIFSKKYMLFVKTLTRNMQSLKVEKWWFFFNKNLKASVWRSYSRKFALQYQQLHFMSFLVWLSTIMINYKQLLRLTYKFSWIKCPILILQWNDFKQQNSFISCIFYELKHICRRF